MNIVPQAGESQVLEQQTRAGASWIYWIAGLSLINVITALAGISFGFYLTLMVPLGIAGIAHDTPDMVGKVVRIVIAVFLCALFALFGILASRGARWAFIVAILCYMIDAAIWGFVREWLGVLLHAYALWRMAAGMMAAFALAKLRKAALVPAGYQGVRDMQNTAAPGAWSVPPSIPPAIPPAQAPPGQAVPAAQQTPPSLSPLSQSPAEPPISPQPLDPNAHGPVPPGPTEEQAG